MFAYLIHRFICDFTKYSSALFIISNFCDLDMITLLGLDEYNGRLETTLTEVIKK